MKQFLFEILAPNPCGAGGHTPTNPTPAGGWILRREKSGYGAKRAFAPSVRLEIRDYYE